MRPDHGFIGCEPFLNGVVSALNHIRDDALSNVRLHMGDALEVLERLPDASLSRVYLLHPDPWPKARHAKRRMVNNGPLDLIAAKLKPGCEFRLGTDDPTYCRWSMMVMNRAAISHGRRRAPPISSRAPPTGPKRATSARRAGRGTRCGISFSSESRGGRRPTSPSEQSSRHPAPSGRTADR